MICVHNLVADYVVLRFGFGSDITEEAALKVNKRTASCHAQSGWIGQKDAVTPFVQISALCLLYPENIIC